MSVKHITFIILTLIVGCNQQPQTNNYSQLRLLTYGGPPDMKRQSARNVIADKWGIEFYSVAGCAVTNELVDSVDRHNLKIDKLIKEKYGNDWEDKFDKEVNLELNKQNKATSLLIKEDRIIKKEIELEQEGNGLDFRFQPIDSNTYNINAVGWGQIGSKDEYVIYFKYLVDIKKEKVKFLSDSLMKE